MIEMRIVAQFAFQVNRLLKLFREHAFFDRERRRKEHAVPAPAGRPAISRSRHSAFGRDHAGGATMCSIATPFPRLIL